MEKWKLLGKDFYDSSATMKLKIVDRAPCPKMQYKKAREKGKKKKKRKWKPLFYQSQVSILGPVGYGPTTLPLRH